MIGSSGDPLPAGSKPEGQETADSRHQVDDRSSRALQYLFSEVELVRHLDLQLVDWDEHSARVRMPFSAAIDNRSGTPLGGALATLVDIAGAAAVWAGHDFSKGGRHATVSISINFVGAARNEAVLATARCVRRQQELTYVSVDVESESGRIVANGLLTFRVVPQRRDTRQLHECTDQQSRRT